MPNTSATGGYLSPSEPPAQLEDDALLDVLQTWIVGITGLNGQNVRPRWQPEPPNILPVGNWVAFGIIRRPSDTYAYEEHSGVGEGSSKVKTHETLVVLVSFYGPNASSISRRLKNGMAVAQNREVLSLSNMALIDSGDLIIAPELIKDKWLNRVDLEVRIRHQVVVKYDVLNLQSAQVILDNEHYLTNINS